MEEKIYMRGYKGYEPGLICRGKQYAENTVFEEPEAEICKSGMHFCKSPFDVINYYGFTNKNGEFNEFTEVDALDDCVTDNDKKFCTKKLRIGRILLFEDFIGKCIEYMDTIGDKHSDESIGASNIMNSCDYAHIESSGDYAKIISSGDYAKIISSGYRAYLRLVGYHTLVISIGHCAKIINHNDDAHIASAGNTVKIRSAGDFVKITSSGNNSEITSTGDGARITISGYHANVISIGDCASITSYGGLSAICCTGKHSRVKGRKGDKITLSEWGWSVDGRAHIPVCIKTECVDGERIKEDTFYSLINGEFVEVK